MTSDPVILNIWATLIRKLKQKPTTFRLGTFKRLAEQLSAGDWLLPAQDAKPRKPSAASLGHVGDASESVQSRRALRLCPFL
jgi:hypothetical protein